MKPIAVVCTARPSYAKLKPVLAALQAAGAPVRLVLTSGTLLHRFGNVAEQAEQDFPLIPQGRVYAELDGYNGITAAKSTAGLLASLADLFSWITPGLVVVNHDRREVLAAAQAASYQNIPVAHIGGGEVSGNIDDKVRDAITCLSDRHYPATTRASLRVEELTGKTVYPYGCPTIDLAHAALAASPVAYEELGGVGPAVDFGRPFALVLQHPETEDPEASFRQMMTTLNAVKGTRLPAVVMWPGMDAGADGAAKAIRLHQAEFHCVRTLPPERFLRLMAQASVLVGNSSAGIRESSYLGTPVVNIGPRQQGREHGANVVNVHHDYEAIRKAVAMQSVQVYPRSTLYGDGNAAERIAGDLIR